MKRVLVAVDVQKEFKDNDGRYEDILDFIINPVGYDEVIGTVCINTPDSNFVKLGDWSGCMGVVDGLEYIPDRMIIKNGFGLSDYSILDKNCEYHLIGFNTDACVLKIALDMFDLGYNFKVLVDYCYSSNGNGHHIRGVEVMKSLFPKAVVEIPDISDDTDINGCDICDNCESCISQLNNEEEQKTELGKTHNKNLVKVKIEKKPICDVIYYMDM